jgi:RNA polymerase sigma factor (TIGR02999 family)
MNEPIFSFERPVTALLERWKSGDRAVEDELIKAVYPYMRALASANLRRYGRGIAQTTELANEAYLRLQGKQNFDWQSRSHFLAIIAAMTRNVVIDLMREKYAAKRGGSIDVISIDHEDAQHAASAEDEGFDWIALDSALKALANEDPICAKVAEIKLFSAMNIEQIADACELSTATIGRHWRFAKVWLTKRLSVKLDDNECE